MNHAMCITGVNQDGNNKWKIENSNDGKMAIIMSRRFVDVYQAVIDKKYLTKNSRHEKTDMLKPWDPMGSLAD